MSTGQGLVPGLTRRRRVQARESYSLCTAFAFLALLAACGERTTKGSGQVGGDSGVPLPDGQLPMSFLADSSLGDGNTACAVDVYKGERRPLDMVALLDQSGSMLDPPGNT